jgi:hypothetical protein
MDFSRAASRLIASNGSATSISFFLYGFGIRASSAQ